MAQVHKITTFMSLSEACGAHSTRYAERRPRSFAEPHWLASLGKGFEISSDTSSTGHFNAWNSPMMALWWQSHCNLMALCILEYLLLNCKLSNLSVDSEAEPAISAALWLVTSRPMASSRAQEPHRDTTCQIVQVTVTETFHGKHQS